MEEPAGAPGQPTAAGPTQESEPQQPQEAESTPPQQAAPDKAGDRQIKPIPPRAEDGKFQKKDLKESALGFKPRTDRDGSIEKLGPLSARPGRPATPPSAPQATQPLKPGEKPPAAPGIQPAQPKPEPFQFAGRTWESREKAEHAVSTMQGMWKQKEAEVASQAQNANAWYQVAKRLGYKDGTDPFAEPAGAMSASASAAAPGPSEDESLGALKGIDMGVYAALVNDQSVGPAGAAAWLAAEVAKGQRESIMAEVKTMLQPYAEEAQAREEMGRITTATSNVFGWAESQKNSGNPDYARVGEPTYDHQIGQIMAYLESRGMNRDELLSPMGYRLALLIHRDMNGQAGAQPGAQPNAAAAAVAAALSQPTPGQEPVSGPSAAPSRPGRPLTEEQAVKESLRNAPHIDPVLGFRKRGSASQVI